MLQEGFRDAPKTPPEGALVWGLGRHLEPARGRPGAFSRPRGSFRRRRIQDFGSCPSSGGHLGA
eukprot:9133179-Pyramimonas_sp.AAC.1